MLLEGFRRRRGGGHEAETEVWGIRQDNNKKKGEIMSTMYGDAESEDRKARMKQRRQPGGMWGNTDMCKCSRCAVFWCYTTVAWRRMKLHLEIKILNQEDLYFIFLQHWNLLLPLWNNNTGMLFRCCTCPTSLDIMAPPAAGKQDCTSTILYCSPVSNSDLQYLVNWCICDSLPVSLDCVGTPIIAKTACSVFTMMSLTSVSSSRTFWGQ